MRILELSAHDWDIRQPHETHAHLSLTAVPALLSAMPELQVQLLGLRVTEGLDGAYALRAGDAAGVSRSRGRPSPLSREHLTSATLVSVLMPKV